MGYYNEVQSENYDRTFWSSERTYTLTSTASGFVGEYGNDGPKNIEIRVCPECGALVYEYMSNNHAEWHEKKVITR